MKILKVTLKNLNSLAGTWIIDLTHPAYSDDGIFAITGPTGSGKTTILDAVSLALFGRTPRLDRISSSTNEIMHRQAAECLAEVEYATATGTFRCTWAQERAYRRTDGKLQQPRHEIADCRTGEVLATKKKEVQELVEETCGMDYERFTRSVMLAQGAFAAFLNASPDERSPLLEQITGTEIYSDISRAVHARTKSEQDTLRVLQAEMEGIRLFAPEEREELRHRQAELAAAGEALRTRIAAVREDLAWHRTMQRIAAEVGAIAIERADLVEQTAQAQEGLGRLAADRRAAALEGDYRSLVTRRSAQEHDRQILDGHLAALPCLREGVELAGAAVATGQTALTEARAAAERAAPVLREARELDLRLQAAAGRLEDLGGALAEDEREWEAAEAALRRTRSAPIPDDTMDAAGAFLAACGIPGAPAAEYAAICTAADALPASPDGTPGGPATLLSDACDAAESRKATLLSSLAAVPSFRDPATIRREEAVAQEETMRLTLLLGGLSRADDDRKRQADLAVRIDEARRERDGHATALQVCRDRREDKEKLVRQMEENARSIALIKNYEEERRHLREGEMCPLCGATSHPFAVGGEAIPRENAREILQEQEALGTLRDEETDLRSAIARCGIVIDAAGQEQEEIAVQAAEAEGKWTDACRTCGLDPGAPDREAAVRAALRENEERLQHLDATSRGVAACTRLLDATETLIFRGRQAAASALKRAASVTRTNDAMAVCERLAHQRRSLPAPDDPSSEEERLSREIRRAEESLEAARDRHAAAVQAVAGREGEVRTLEDALRRREEVIADGETAFGDLLREAGFGGEEEFVSSLLTPAERSALESERSRLETWVAGLDARERSLAAEQDDHLRGGRPAAEAEALEAELAALNTAQEENAAAVGGVRQRLRRDDEERARCGEQERRIEAQKAETDRWNRLHTLIGSADGKKFRNYAQGLTFERMVAAANRQLMQMSRRYILTRSPDTPLELSVIDNDQGGRIRSTRNLSGGESFLVSLALALGLASMASGRVRVDSLFLDEGFGTLDEDALEMALATLTTLRDQGKLIGVISHVPALKERIGTAITVSRSGGGTSRLEGPGITFLRR